MSSKLMSTDKGKTRRHRAVAKKVVRSDEECDSGGADKLRARSASVQPPGDGGSSTKGLEDELVQMESELGEMQRELEQVQKEREILEDQRRVLKAVNRTGAAPGHVLGPACVPARGVQRGGWRNEQTLRLQEDLDAKVLENCELRSQVERLKEGLEATQLGLENWETRALELEQKLRTLENQKNKMVGSRETALEQQQMLGVFKQKYEVAQDELEEMRALIEDQAGHLEGYRNKYLMAQQQAEERRRHLEHAEAEQDRMSEQVFAELQRVKAEFEERLQELALLPDIVKTTQSKMQEEKRLRLIAEQNCADLNHELAATLERIEENEKEMNFLRTQQQTWMDERQSMLTRVDASERKCSKLEWYKQQLEQYREHSEKLYEDTVQELNCVRAELEASKDQSARIGTRLQHQVHQTETMSRSLHSQISELEKQLAASRAIAAAAHKEKEELQQRFKAEVFNMNQSVGQAQDRIMNLKSVVDVIKNNVLSAKVEKVAAECLPET